MSDCCLPNLGCLSIPVVSTNVAGIPGTNGISPTITVGTVTTGAPGDPVTVTNVGTENAAIFDFEIPAGAAGGAGAAGVAGVTRLYTSAFTGNTTTTTINGWQSMGTYTLQAGSLVNIGDSLVINFETELLLKNSTSSGPFPVRKSPLRRISIASGTSLTNFDSLNALAEPQMTTVSASSATMSFSYKTTLELIKVSTNNSATNFIRKCTYDFTTPSTPSSFSNGSTSLLSINTNNPIVFSFDLYQYQLSEILVKNATIDKITGVIP